jgi:hypothetical protein
MSKGDNEESASDSYNCHVRNDGDDDDDGYDGSSINGN